MSVLTDFTVRAVIEALLRLPEGSKVLRVERNENPEVQSFGYSGSCIENSPRITIEIALPKTQTFRPTGA